jgi:hypothetical protein
MQVSTLAVILQKQFFLKEKCIWIWKSVGKRSFGKLKKGSLPEMFRENLILK